MGFPFGSNQPMGCFSKRFGKLKIVDHLEHYFEVIDSTTMDSVLGFNFIKAIGFSFGFLEDPSLVALVVAQRHLDH